VPGPPFDCEWGFPPPFEWPDDDVVAVGGDLSPDTLLHAYSHGFFPMRLDAGSGPLAWWSPVRRGIFPLDGLRITRSLRRSCRRFEVTVDRDFRSVMQECAKGRADGNWIEEDFVEAYCRLHEMGWAHSIEVRIDGLLVGGLYGVRIGGFFAGESMFHRERDASKAALVALVGMMRLDGMVLLDTQWCTEHLASLGCTEVPRLDYLALLESATGVAILGG
jgi:leucyl/phenylalanyl-tRNA--protein transferase